MADKLSVQDWDTVQTNNTMIGGINIAEGWPPKNANDSDRTCMAQIAEAMLKGHLTTLAPVQVTENRPVGRDDNGAVGICTTALTLTYAAAADLKQAHLTGVKATGGDVTVTATSPELIDGQTSVVIPNGSSAVIVSTGGSGATTTLHTFLSNGDSVRYAPQTRTASEQGQARANIDARPYKNHAFNGNFVVNQRNGTKTPGIGVYGFDRWKGHANGLEQVIPGMAAGEYTLHWQGGGNGTFGGTTAASPIKATITAGDTPIIVPSTADEVSLLPGDWTAFSNPFVAPDPVEEFIRCLPFFERVSANNTSTQFCGGQSLNGTACTFTMNYSPKRAVPSVSLGTNILADFEFFESNNLHACTTFTGAFGATPTRCRLDLVFASHTSGNAGQLKAKTTSAFVDVDAEVPSP